MLPQLKRTSRVGTLWHGIDRLQHPARGEWGCRGRRFKSSRPDHFNTLGRCSTCARRAAEFAFRRAPSLHGKLQRRRRWRRREAGFLPLVPCTVPGEAHLRAATPLQRSEIQLPGSRSSRHNRGQLLAVSWTRNCALRVARSGRENRSSARNWPLLPLSERTEPLPARSSFFVTWKAGAVAGTKPTPLAC